MAWSPSVFPPVTVARAESTSARPSGATGYRSDLDGLRGLAIGLVVVFHVWFGRVSGGVDVFLVLSGFFFTGLLLRRAESGEIGWAWQVVRRTARRLVPAMAVVLAGVVVATMLMLPYTQWSDVATQTLASLLFAQNWELALSWADYLAADPSVSPLQHLWSMSVQGQFYVLVLLVVAVCARSARVRPYVGVIVIAAAAASFVYAGRGVATQQGWNYYDTFARGWELLAGAALAVVAPYLSLPRWLRGPAAVFGIAGVVLCGWVIADGANRFPGPAALLPVCAAAAVIMSVSNVAPGEWGAANRLLAHPAMRWLGDIAYPLYLWHWPILIFFLTERDSAGVDLLGGVGVIAVSLAVAWLTHQWIELPLREKRSRPGVFVRRLVLTTVSMLVAAVVTVAAVWQFAVGHASPPRTAELAVNEYPGAEALAGNASTPDAPMRPTVLDAGDDLPPPTLDGCIADWNTRAVITCTYGDPDAERTIAMAGSSHVEHWLPALQVLATQHSFRIQVYLKMGCPLTLAEDATYAGESIPDCRDWSREVVERLAADRPDWVFTIGTRPRDAGGDETPPEYLDVWSALSAHGLNVVTMRDTPWLRRDSGRYRATDCLAAGGDRISCGMRRTDALAPVSPQLEPASRFPSIFPIDLSDAVCTPTVCAVVEGNILVYHDEHHLTATYARSLAGPLGRTLGPVLGWW
ncbi:acyltransferase family protein [Nocardia halotolerans]|uniref:Acyltransferase family protein n=1 Tax=Nocardia halotolerans TaxID=1755878 RepID=A0ABV8VL92_9NOCA